MYNQRPVGNDALTRGDIALNNGEMDLPVVPANGVQLAALTKIEDLVSRGLFHFTLELGQEVVAVHMDLPCFAGCVATTAAGCHCLNIVIDNTSVLWCSRGADHIRDLGLRETKYNTDQDVITAGAKNPAEKLCPKLETTKKTMNAFSIMP